jgi:hypothetical protein
MNKDN